MRYMFNFEGGIIKYPDAKTVSKFLLFHILPNLDKGGVDEKLLFQSIKEGHIVDNRKWDQNPSNKSEHEFKYSTDNPLLKIFSLVEGFGIQKQFYSFFFALDIHGTVTSILPLCEGNQQHNFVGRGRFMNADEVKELLGEESISFRFFKQQAPLPRSVLNRVIITGAGFDAGINPATQISRRIRL